MGTPAAVVLRTPRLTPRPAHALGVPRRPLVLLRALRARRIARKALLGERP